MRSRHPDEGRGRALRRERRPQGDDAREVGADHGGQRRAAQAPAANPFASLSLAELLDIADTIIGHLPRLEAAERARQRRQLSSNHEQKEK
jgi:hypothetical protein